MPTKRKSPREHPEMTENRRRGIPPCDRLSLTNRGSQERLHQMGKTVNINGMNRSPNAFSFLPVALRRIDFVDHVLFTSV